jgi:hypothetical protein
MRRCLASGVMTALLAGCNGAGSPAGPPPTRPAVSSSTSPAVRPATNHLPGAFRPHASARPLPRCTHRRSAPRTRPAQDWDVNGDGRGDVPVIYGSGGDESGAVGVLHLLLTSPSGKVRCDDPVVGKHNGFGSRTASGDFNGDGYADVAVTDIDTSDVTVYPGSASGLLGSQAVDVPHHHNRFGRSDQHFFGHSLAAADFDRDGFDDLAIGVPQMNPPAVDFGSVVVLWGGRHGVLGGQAEGRPGRYRIRSSLRHFGATIAAGDVTGDGYPDLVESAGGDADQYYYRGRGEDRLALLKGGPRGPRHPDVVGRGVGNLVVGDVTGDGTDDVVSNGPGKIRLYLGSRHGLGQPTVVVPGQDGMPGPVTRRDRFHAVAVVSATANRPGFLVAAAPNHWVDGHRFAGALWLAQGSATGIDLSSAHVVTQGTPTVPGAIRPDTYLGEATLVRDVVGGLRPELVVRTFHGSDPGPVIVLRLTHNRVRGSVYALLPKHLDSFHLPS